MNPRCISSLGTLTGRDRKWMDDAQTDLFDTFIFCRNFCVLGEASNIIKTHFFITCQQDIRSQHFLISYSEGINQ